VEHLREYKTQKPPPVTITTQVKNIPPHSWVNNNVVDTPVSPLPTTYMQNPPPLNLSKVPVPDKPCLSPTSQLPDYITKGSKLDAPEPSKSPACFSIYDNLDIKLQSPGKQTVFRSTDPSTPTPFNQQQTSHHLFKKTVWPTKLPFVNQTPVVTSKVKSNAVVCNISVGSGNRTHIPNHVKHIEHYDRVYDTVTGEIDSNMLKLALQNI